MAVLLDAERDKLPERLWSRDFTLLFLARTVSVLGDQMLVPITITVAVLRAGYGVTGVGYALAANTAPLALLVIIGGVISDRFTPVRVMIVADLARLVLHGVLALSFALGRPDLWLICALLALSGVCTAAFQPGYGSLIPRTARDVQRANAAIRVTESLMSVAGPAVAGLLLAFCPVWTVVLIDAGTFALSAGCLLGMRLRLARPAARTSFRLDLVQGWREFRARTWLWSVIVIFMLYQVTVNGPVLTLGQSLITLRHGERALGLIMSAFGLGALLGGLLAARIRPVFPLRAGSVAMACTVVGVLAVALDWPPALLAAGYALAGVGGAFWLVMFHSSVQTKIPPDVLGRVHAYDVAGSLVMKPVGQLAAGPASVWIGAVPVLFFSSGMLLVTVALLLAVPAVRNVRRTG